MNNSPKTIHQSKAVGIWDFYSPEGKVAVRHYIDGEEIK
jgi:hypothetical protein